MAKEEPSIPTGRIRRTAKVAQVIGASGAGSAGARARSVGRGQEARTEQLDRVHMEAAERMVDTLGTMKGAAMKIGQLASFIDTEFLPPEYRELYQEKLSALRTSAPPMSWDKVSKVLRDEWESDVDELFERFDRDAVAAASIGQVHRAILPDGRGFEDIKELPQDKRDRFGEIVFRFCFGSIYHLQHFNADAHPGNYVLMLDGKVAFLDFGMTKQLDKEQIELEIAALEAAFDNDPQELVSALHDLGFLRNPKRIDAERMMEHVKAVGGWYMEDRDLTIDSELVMRAISAVTDPRSDFYDLMRRENVPANELMGRRMESGVLAVLGQLNATRNWYRIGREGWFAEEPATELGREEWEFFEAKGERRGREVGARTGWAPDPGAPLEQLGLAAH